MADCCYCASWNGRCIKECEVRRGVQGGTTLNKQRKSRTNQQTAKTYNSKDSLMVTHLTTNPPVSCLNRAERTGSLVVSCPTTTETLSFTVSGTAHAMNWCLYLGGKATKCSAGYANDRG
jgi:hypothetical protein